MIVSCAEILQLIFVPVKHADSQMGTITMTAKSPAGVCAILVDMRVEKKSNSAIEGN